MVRWQRASIVVAVTACCALGAAGNAWAKSRGGFVWGGYATISTSQSTVTATMTVPSYSCTTQPEGVESGVAIIHPPAVYFAYGVLSMICGGVSPYAVDLITGAGTTQLNLSVAAGNKLRFSLSTATKLTVKDITTGQSASATGPGGSAAQCYVGYWPIFTGSTQDPIPAFNTITFSAAAIGGKPISSYLTSRELTEANLNRGSTVEIQTGAINTTAEGYVGTFKNN